MTFLRNTWYVAAWDHELTQHDMLSRTLLNEPVVLFRDQHGSPVALADRCPHRFAPLSMGTLCDGAVQCRYHGLRFDTTGRCVHNPHAETIPKAAKVHAYPLVERYSAIWIWTGEPELADPASIPDYSGLDPETAYVCKDYLHARAHYMLETDNILDLSHIEFMHRSTLGSPSVRSAETSIEQVGNTVWSRRLTHDEKLPPFLAQAFRVGPDDLVDRWMDVRWDPPANMLLLSGVTAPGTAPRQVQLAHNVHFFTPETDSTTHYWFAFGFSRAMGEQGQLEANAATQGVRMPFEYEDLPMLEAQQKNMRGESFWSLKPVLLVGDAAGVRARRILESLIAAESAQSPSTASAVQTS